MSAPSQAVCEEDLEAVPPGLLFDVDPAAGEALAAAPQLAAALASTLRTTTAAHNNTGRFGQQQHQQQQQQQLGRGASGGAHASAAGGVFLESGGAAGLTGTGGTGGTGSLEALPAYLRLRMYMMQACASRWVGDWGRGGGQEGRRSGGQQGTRAGGKQGTRGWGKDRRTLPCEVRNPKRVVTGTSRPARASGTGPARQAGPTANGPWPLPLPCPCCPILDGSLTPPPPM